MPDYTNKRSSDDPLVDFKDRTYRDIKNAAGDVIYHAPKKRSDGSYEDGSVVAIGGLHPDDFFEVDDNGVATVNAG